MEVLARLWLTGWFCLARPGNNQQPGLFSQRRWPCPSAAHQETRRAAAHDPADVKGTGVCGGSGICRRPAQASLRQSLGQRREEQLLSGLGSKKVLQLETGSFANSCDPKINQSKTQIDQSPVVLAASVQCPPVHRPGRGDAEEESTETTTAGSGSTWQVREAREHLCSESTESK